MDRSGWFRKLAGACIAGPVHRLGGSREQVVAARAIAGLVAAGALAAGAAWFSAAAGLLLFGGLLARADAGLARRSGGADPRADRRAFLADLASNALAFLGLGAGVQAGAGALQAGVPAAPPPVLMGLVAALAVAAVPLLAKRLETINGRRSSEFDGMAGFDGDDILFLVPVALWLGWAEGLLMLTAFGGAAFAGGLYMAHFRKFHARV